MGYSELYLKHFTAPCNVGELEDPSAKVEVEHEGGGCFDKLRLTINVENNVVTEAMFKARACSGTIAASSAATEWAQGKPVEELKKASADMLDGYLGGVPEKKRHSVELAARALREAAESL